MTIAVGENTQRRWNIPIFTGPSGRHFGSDLDVSVPEPRSGDIFNFRVGKCRPDGRNEKL